ncbi:MAG TPA: imidazole glycerol phosphate synthase subunit HisH [Spirochaetota bacterium]|nr:imidazole glycerol phosphate synthase subunit HisH [Spirochaetota bacterium]HOM38825.1 imidazole glycerol phosphate synthase subunit HisH [Spirochaetota bacterium]HPQ49883.1 imidazole glycerol phosphate synthase subunit HisH [Spirochaetota bacterium]
MIGIIDYQGGNLNNVKRAFEFFGFNVEIINEPVSLKSLNGLVLPGVGAFSYAMSQLKEKGFVNFIRDFVESGKPFMGICLGIQLLFEKSYEFEKSDGLGIIKGDVVKFKKVSKIPHIGWNQVFFKKDSKFLKGTVKNSDFFYFVHSYYVVPEDNEVILTTTLYENEEFVSSIEKDNIFACQFHPEKSQENGLKIIKAFGEFCVNTSN